VGSSLDLTGMTSSYSNPFAVDSPERLTARAIADLFVEEFTQVRTVRERKHTFVWGSRGSGKSMMFRWLEPECQGLISGGFDKFLSSSEPFLGVYCPMKVAHFRRSEAALLNPQVALILTEHMLNLAIGQRVVACLRNQVPATLFNEAGRVSFAEYSARLFDPASLAPSVLEANEWFDVKKQPLDWLESLFAIELRKVGAYLMNRPSLTGDTSYCGATSGYHDFLLPFLSGVQRYTGLGRGPIYILLDDGDRLSEALQTVVNTWIANRDQATLCVKVSARHEGYLALLTRDGGLIEAPHDFSEIDVDELYTSEESDYVKKVYRIANRRLERSSVPCKDVSAFLPPDPTEQELLERMKADTAAEWASAGRPGREKDFVERYATARLFQNLKSRKQKKSYAGFANIAHLSSGVVRDFLEPCYQMVNKCVSSGTPIERLTSIPASLQDEVISKQSEAFLLRLEHYRPMLSEARRPLVEKLRTLLESLGRLFYRRLHDPNSRDARLFSFTVSGAIPPDIRDVLELGVALRYLHLATYSTKDGGGREPWYILNRWLCPDFKLDPTGFKGRISISPGLLQVACSDPERFTRLRLRTPDPEVPDLFALGEGEAEQ